MDRKSDKYKDALMGTARIWAQQSYCNKRKVGAVIEQGGRILSTGFNGTEPGDCNVCEFPDGSTDHNRVVHAERNAITFLPKEISDVRMTMWCTTAPCINCAKLILDVGNIRRVVYDDIYKNEDGVNLLLENGIKVVKFSELE